MEAESIANEYELDTGFENATVSDTLEYRVTSREAHSQLQQPSLQDSDAAQKHALFFDGKTSRVDVRSLKLDGSHPVTIEATVQLESEPKGWAEILDAGGIHLQRLNYGKSNWLACSVNQKFFVHHSFASRRMTAKLAAVHDMNRLTLFVDGEKTEDMPVLKENTGSGTIELGEPKEPMSFRPRDDEFTCIGVTPWNGKNAVHGIIDEVRISNIARYTDDYTPTERFENDEHTLALYHFDSGQGDELLDSSGNGHHGTILGAEWVPQIAKWR